MDEPTHTKESEFWDQVAEWVLRAPYLEPLPAEPPRADLPPGPPPFWRG